MRLVFAGTPEAALPSLDALLAGPHTVAGVVTRPDAPAGRGRHLTPSPVARRAEAAGIPALKPRRAGDADFLDALRELAPDCCPVVAYGALLPERTLDVPRHGWVNLHFSVLPAWRGAAPVQHALLHGDDITGASTFRIVRELDAGPVFGVVTEPIAATDTAGDLLDRLARSGAELLTATLDGIESGALEARPQPVDGVSLAPKLTSDDARVRWDEPAAAVDRRIRACTPAPGAWTTLHDARIKLIGAHPAGEADRLAPGELRVARDRVLAGTGSVPLRLDRVQPPGKRPMPAVDWARGLRPGPGERLR